MAELGVRPIATLATPSILGLRSKAIPNLRA